MAQSLATQSQRSAVTINLQQLIDFFFRINQTTSHFETKEKRYANESEREAGSENVMGQ